ncbi:hypothetical protein ACLB2K_005991 [Fragaria x ananassa]
MGFSTPPSYIHPKGPPLSQTSRQGSKPELDTTPESLLSCTLNIFYPVAGRLSLVENQENTACFFINCNGVGAHFVHAAADGVRVTDFLYVRASEGLAAFSQHFHSGILSNILCPPFETKSLNTTLELIF